MFCFISNNFKLIFTTMKKENPYTAGKGKKRKTSPEKEFLFKITITKHLRTYATSPVSLQIDVA